jgi:hypothetical protein
LRPPQTADSMVFRSQLRNGILRIIRASGPDDQDRIDIIELAADLAPVSDKFEVGVMDCHGSTFCMLLRSRACVTVGCSPCTASKVHQIISDVVLLYVAKAKVE